MRHLSLGCLSCSFISRSAFRTLRTFSTISSLFSSKTRSGVSPPSDRRDLVPELAARRTKFASRQGIPRSAARFPCRKTNGSVCHFCRSAQRTGKCEAARLATSWRHIMPKPVKLSTSILQVPPPIEPSTEVISKQYFPHQFNIYTGG